MTRESSQRHSKSETEFFVTKAKAVQKSAPIGARTSSVPVIAIDGIEYDAANLTDPAEGAWASLRITEERLMALQSELAVCQTARCLILRASRKSQV